MMYLFGWLWCLPQTIVGALILGFLKLFGVVDFRCFFVGGLVFRVQGRLAEYMAARTWYAHTIGPFSFFYVDPTWQEVLHEHHHIVQQFIWGPLQPLMYGACYLWGLVRYRSSFKAYWNNPWEIEARRVAGEE